MVTSNSPEKMKSRSNLERILTQGKFAVTVEIAPPQSCDGGRIRTIARKLKGFADAFNVTDNQRAVVKLSSFAAAVICLQEGLEPVMQMVCRDRNRIAIQSDILGASALGIKNVLCLRGDDPEWGNEKKATPVHDLTPDEQISVLRRMRDEGILAGGDVIDPRPELYIGGTASPFRGPFEKGVEILKRRVEAGADFIQTQAVFDIEGFEEYMSLVRKKGIDKRTHILAGIVPLKSPRMVRFMRDRLPGISIPNYITERMKKASDPQAEGLKMCLETIDSIKEIKGIHGVHIMAISWEEKVPEIIELSGFLPRPF